MALTPPQQAAERILRAKHILLTTNDHASLDCLASVIALGLILQRLNKSFDTLVEGWDPKHYPDILPKDVEIRPKVGATRSFHLRVNLKEVPLNELMYDVRDGILDITLVPKHGSWSLQDVGAEQGADRYDLIIAVDAADMQSLGTLAREQAEFLYRTDIINIDCNPTNEYWGQINLVDLNSVSSTEALYHWLHEWQPSLFDERLATTLLAGMIAKTKSFRTNHVTPRTLAASSELMSLGANREAIVHGLWRTRSVATLKLWGRALSRLEQDRELGLVWTTLSLNDGLEAGANPDTLDGVVDELLSYAPEARVVALLSERKDDVLVSIHAVPPMSAAELARPFNGHGTRERSTFPFKQEGAFVDTIQTVLERLRKTMRAMKA